MFRVNRADLDRPPYRILAGTIIALLLALVLTAVATFFAVLQYRSTVPFVENTVLTWWTIALLGLTTAALCVALVGLSWFWRTSSCDEQYLVKVKMLAHDILASMDQGVITTDQRGIITSINSAASQLLGTDIQCVGQPLEALSTSDYPLAALVNQVAASRTPVRDLKLVSLPAKSIRADAQLLRDIKDHPLGYVVHLRDVTERTLMEERMSRMERFIGLGTLVSGLYHEIKNPLTALSIHVQLLEEGLEEAHVLDLVQELVGVLKTEVQRLGGVLESFRSFANLQRLSIEPTDVSDALRAAASLISPQASEQHVQIQYENITPDKCVAPVDPQKFEQAVVNLLINAMEAMPSGGTLRVRSAIDSTTLRVSVSDTGTGISAEVQKNLFRPYFSTKHHGTGMGLAITEKLVGQHGGQIQFESGPTGTTFELQFPLERKDEAA